MTPAPSTCQCCGRAVKTVKDRIAHHGFKRPTGYTGFQTASCMGARYAPFEQARDRLGDLIRLIRDDITATEAAIAAMQANPERVLVSAAGFGRQAVYCEVADPVYRVRQREWLQRMRGRLTQSARELAFQLERYELWQPVAAIRGRAA